MKKIKLILFSLQMMFKSTRLFTVWLFVLQAMTAFAGIFFFSTVPKATTDLASSLVSVRTIPLSFMTPSKEYSYEQLTDIISKNGVAPPQNYTFNFYAEEEYGLNSHTDVERYSKDVTEGRGINIDDVENKACVIVSGTTVINEENNQYVKTDFELGDSIVIGGVDFEIIGFKSGLYGTFEIPYTTGFDLFALSSFSATFPDGLNDGELSEITEYAVSTIHNVAAQRKLEIGNILFTYNGSIIFTAVFVMLIALLNLCFIYKFVLKRMGRYFAILRMSGFSSKGLSLHIYCIYYIILILSFVLGTVGLLVVKQASIFDVLANAEINFGIILMVFLIFSGIISIFLVQAVLSLRKPVREDLLS